MDVKIRVQVGATAFGQFENTGHAEATQTEADYSNNNSINIVTGITATPTPTFTRTPRPQSSLTPTPSGRFKTLIWSSYNSIQAMRLDTNEQWTIPVNAGCPQGVAVDPTTDRIYRTNCAGQVLRANLNGTNQSTIVSFNYLKSGGPIFVDSAAGKIYWMSNQFPAAPLIMTTGLDGSNPQPYLQLNLNYNCCPLSLDTVTHQIFWEDGVYNIYRQNLDGTNLEQLLGSSTNAVSSLWIDGAAQKVYWVDHSAGTIKRANAQDGTNPENVAPGYAYSMAFDGGGSKLYWLDNYGLKSADLTSLPATTATVLNTPVSYLNEMTFAYLSTSNLPPTATPIPPTSTRVPATATPSALVKNLYWTNSADTIKAIQTDGTYQRTISTPGGSPVGVTYDPVSNKIYWASVTDGVLRRANIDGSNQQNLFFINSPREVAVDGNAGVLYERSDNFGPGYGIVDTWNLNSNSFGGYFYPPSGRGGLALDIERKKIYWGESTGIIRRADLN